MLYQPVQQLFPLKINCDTGQVQGSWVNLHVDNPTLATDEDEVIKGEPSDSTIQRPRKTAAREARDKVMVYGLSKNRLSH